MTLIKYVTKAASIKGGKRCKSPKVKPKRKDFHTEVTINESKVKVLIDTGADVNVISREEAISLGLVWEKCKIKLRPYGSKPLKVCGK